MREQWKWNEDFILATGVLLYVLGAILFEIGIWNSGVNLDWHMAVAMIIGLFIYVHSSVFISAVVMFMLKARDEKDKVERPNPFIVFGLGALDVAAIPQTFFWGIVKTNKTFIIIGLVLIGVLCTMLFFFGLVILYFSRKETK